VVLDLDPARPLPDADTLEERMETQAVRSDYEAKLDAIRRVTGEERFALGIRLIEGHRTPRAIASALCELAEAAIHVAERAARAEFERKRGVIADSEIVMIGLGRLGGGALTHFSDLDVVFLFTGDFSAKSDGERPLGATLYYNRLAARIGAALAVPTAQGAMYEVDTRLRPQGNQGPLAVSLNTFEKYQAQTAWTWEHMALTRARVLIGSDAAREKVDAAIRTRDRAIARFGVAQGRRFEDARRNRATQTGARAAGCEIVARRIGRCRIHRSIFAIAPCQPVRARMSRCAGARAGPRSSHRYRCLG